MLESVTAKAPGRINLIGEHTDYNSGLVLPAAIDKMTTCRLKRNGTVGVVNISSAEQSKDYTLDLHHIVPLADGGWSNYVRGVVQELQQLGAQMGGFDAVFESNVPVGAGVSSSAALECSLAVGLNELFDLQLDDWQLIKAAQMAEHHFAGIKCGIMDQFASIMGRQSQVMRLDCRSLEYDYLPFAPEEYELLLLNTNVAHSLASSAFNKRRSECEEGVAYLRGCFGSRITSLRDADFEQLYIAGGRMSLRIYRRCYHVISENERVQAAVKALGSGDYPELGQLMYASHESLKSDYEVSCPELDFLVDQAQQSGFVLGSRMMGGGFGGCTINLIASQDKEAFVDLAARKYRKQFGIDLTPIEVNVEDGARISCPTPTK